MSTAVIGVGHVARTGLLDRINGRWHRRSLAVFAAIVLVHWAEHVLQAVQIWAFDMARPDAKGAFGYLFPWLVTSEWLHYGFAIAMLAGLALLLPGFSGRSKVVWGVALGIQVWHHFEHALLLYQAQANHNLFGKAAPTSVLQLIWQRPELHLFYNALVTAPMLLAMWLHTRPTAAEKSAVSCTCAGRKEGAALSVSAS